MSGNKKTLNKKSPKAAWMDETKTKKQFFNFERKLHIIHFSDSHVFVMIHSRFPENPLYFFYLIRYHCDT